MPLFTFECLECGNVFEELIKKDNDTFCKKCGSKKCNKYIGIPSIVFVGNGWAKDGYSNIPQENTSAISRRAIIGDRNTGETIGFGGQEFSKS